MFGMNYLVISSQKAQDLHLCLVWINFTQSNPFCVSCGKKYTGLKKVDQRRSWRCRLILGGGHNHDFSNYKWKSLSL